MGADSSSLPLVSVYPQELLYRAFFLHRYQPLFGRGWGMLLASAMAFGFVHIIFRNSLAVALCVIGGFLFSLTLPGFRLSVARLPGSRHFRHFHLPPSVLASFSITAPGPDSRPFIPLPKLAAAGKIKAKQFLLPLAEIYGLAGAYSLFSAAHPKEMPPHGDDTQIAEARPGLSAHQRYEAQRHQVQQALALADSRRAGADLLAVAASAFRDRKAEVEVANRSQPVNGPAGVLNASGYITPRRRATIARKSRAASPVSCLMKELV